MRILLTTISLTAEPLAGEKAPRVFPEGAVVEGVQLQEGEAYGEDQIPLDVATARLAAGTAQPVVDGVTSISPAASDAIAQMAASVESARIAAVAFLDAAEAGTDSDKLALAEAMKSVSYDLGEDQRERMRAFHDQLDAIHAELAKADKPKRGRNQGGAA